jgi:hypothetical protein
MHVHVAGECDSVVNEASTPPPQDGSGGNEGVVSAFGSPVLMDQDTQNQGEELLEMLRLFKEATTSPLSSFVLQTPQHKLKENFDVETTSAQKKKDKDPERRSPRLDAKNTKGSSIMKLATDLVAKNVPYCRRERPWTT